MTRCLLLTYVTVLLAVSPVFAENGKTLTNEIEVLHDMVRNDILASAEKMPAEDFDFRPHSEVRTFGQLVGHIATSLFGFCSTASGVKKPDPSIIEEQISAPFPQWAVSAEGEKIAIVDKVDLLKALTAAHEFCDDAYVTMDDVRGMENLKAWREGTRLSFFIQEIRHSSLHYGNMVTYMRLKGVPHDVQVVPLASYEWISGVLDRLVCHPHQGLVLLEQGPTVVHDVIVNEKLGLMSDLDRLVGQDRLR